MIWTVSIMRSGGQGFIYDMIQINRDFSVPPFNPQKSIFSDKALQK